jgi:toxin CcdB
MARFDVFAAGPGDLGFWLDCQSDLLSHLTHRFVVPLIPLDAAPMPIARLNPVFRVGDIDAVMMTHFASAVPVKELGRRIATLVDEHDRIMQALDTLLTDA